MSKVIQVRGVPDDVHAKLVEAAESEGRSLTAFVLEQLESVVERFDPVSHDERVIRKLRDEVGVTDVSRDEVRQILDEGRRELDARADRIVERHRRQHT